MEPPVDENQEGVRHPETLENRTPNAVMAIYSEVIQFLQQYGWFVLLAIILIFIVKHRLQQYLASRPSRHLADQDLHRYDSETTLRRQEAFEASRRRLQERMDAEAARFAEEQKKRNEDKRKQKIADWDNHLEGKGYRSKYRPSDESGSTNSSATDSAAKGSQKKKPNTYRSTDYNPLMGGGGGGGSYRPAARRGGGG